MLPVETITEVKGAEPAYQKALAFIEGFDIVTPEDYTFATECLKDAKSNWKTLETRRKAVTRPILEAKNGVDALFKPSLDILERAETVLKAKIIDYTVKVEAERVAAMMALSGPVVIVDPDSKVSFGTPILMTDALSIPEPPQAKGISISCKWDFEVLTPEDVPRDLCSPDPEKIKARIWYADTDEKKPNDIPGIRFFKKQTLSVRVK